MQHEGLDDTYLAYLDEMDRRLAKQDFLAFYMRMTGFLPPRHIKVISKLLQSMEEDKVDRAMIFAPPRHAKTTMSCLLFPAWIMGRHPKTKLMTIAHTADYALEIGGRVRNLTKYPEWPFDDFALAEDSQAKDRWKTSAGGEMNTFGATAGNQHGRAAEWLFMDDIVKGREIAMSPGQRDKVWTNYITDMRTRLQGRRKQLITFTRWHNDDPAGRILPENFDGKTGWYRDRSTGEKWFVLSMPAVAEHENDPVGRQPGEWLWPEAFGEKELGPERKRGGWMWSALYQQRPSPEEGLMFREEHFQRYDPVALDRSRLQIYITSDYAVTAEAGSSDPDYTVHIVWGVDREWNLYLLDGWRGRTEPDRWVKAWIALCRKWKPLLAGEEQGQIIKSVGPFLKAIMAQENVFVMRRQLASSVNKEMRAQALLGMCALGRFYLPARDKVANYLLQFLDAFESEMLQFPTGKHDDTVDAATLMARLLDQIIAGRERETKGSPHGDTLEDLFRRNEEEDRRRHQ